MNLLRRYKKLTFWNKFAFWGSLTSIIGLLIFILQFIVNNNEITITPKSYIAHSVYQEFTAHVTNKFDYPVYDYSVFIMVKEGSLDVNRDLTFNPMTVEQKTTSEFPIEMWGWGGISNKYGLSFMELHFAEIAPHTTQKYLVKIHGEKYNDKSTIEFYIGGYKKVPNPMFSIPVKLDKNGNPPAKLQLPDSMKKEAHDN
jgi:hypothetical protein